MIDLSLILPVHNEETIIKPVFSEIIKILDSLGICYECLLVENGSSDKTLDTIRKLKKKYKNTKILIARKGYGSAVLAGLNKAKGKYVSYMPSDGQIDLSVFPKLWKLVKKEKWEMVKIKRSTRESLDRTIISITFSFIVKLLFNTPFLDINGSPRILLRKNIGVFDGKQCLKHTFAPQKKKGLKIFLKSKDSFIDAEFAVKASLASWRIKEVPMKTLPRRGGQSTRSWKTFAEFFNNLTRFKILMLKSERQKSRYCQSEKKQED